MDVIPVLQTLLCDALSITVVSEVEAERLGTESSCTPGPNPEQAPSQQESPL